MERRENQIDRHHILPSSRGGSGKAFNRIRVQKKRHKAYHIIFENLTPDEVMELIFKIYNHRLFEKLPKRQRLAWILLFGKDAEYYQVRHILMYEFGFARYFKGGE